MNEQLSEFLFGCHLHDSESTVAFYVDWIGTDFAFSPDVDVLEINDEEAIGYEVEERRNGSVQKQQIYSGLALLKLSIDGRFQRPCWMHSA
jgi:hypothetical protein